MIELKKYSLESVCSRLSSGKNIKATEVVENGTYPVYGGNGLRGYAEKENFSGDCAIIGRQGAYCGNVRFFSGTAYMTEHAVVVQAKTNHNTRYLSYLLASMQLGRLSGQSAQPGLSVKVLGQQTVLLPDKEIQDKISGLIAALENKIEINNQINRNLSEQAQALYQSWFVEFKPFGGKRPLDWEDGTVDDLALEIVCGKTPSTKKEEYYGNDMPFVTIPDMHDGVYVVTTARSLSNLGVDSQKKKTLPKNSICVSCIGTAGLSTLLPCECQTNQQINSIIPKTNYSPYYIYLLMLTMTETINKLGQGGSTIVNLNKAQFGKMEVQIPSVKSMNQFDEIVGPIFESILRRQYENIKLGELRDCLLPKLMSGELDVSNIEI